MGRVTACLTCLAAVFFVFATSVRAVPFYPISDISSSTAATDYLPASSLIQGPGIGFDAAEPHDKLGGFGGHWVTDAPCGFPADYIACAGMPVLIIDLGQDVALWEISIWGYSSVNANGVSQFSLRFATEAEGPAGFGNSIGFNPSFFPTNDDTVRQAFPFGQTVTARWVEFTAVDNFFIEPGDGSTGELPGGDRVGLGEIAFAKPSPIPEPATMLLDFDGDAKTDIALYRSSTGAWFYIPSSTGPSGIYGVGFGGDATDKPVPGDYDGDGKTDPAIYRADIGSWFIYPSSTGPSGIYGVGFGGDESDLPVITNPGSYM